MTPGPRPRAGDPVAREGAPGIGGLSPADAQAERDLLNRIVLGDRSAFEALFHEHYEPLVGFADGILRSRDVAEDAVQEVFFNMWRQRETIRVEGSVRSYLFRAVRNRGLNRVRHERVRREAAPHVVAASGSPAPADAGVIEAELAAAIRRAVAALPPRCREVFELSREQGLRYSEIASTLAISVKTVETQMGRALKALREQLAPYLP